jgi:uncharacterized membrane protein
MKTIKVILIIIIILTVAFLATGIVVKETTYEANVTIDKPILEVFTEFNNAENTKNWIPEIISLETVNENLGKTGSVYNIVIENQNQEIMMTQKVMAYVPNEKVTYFFDAENMLKKDDYVFSEKDGATVINLKAACNSKTYIMSCMIPYFKGKLEEQSQLYLDNFKEYIENKE